MDDDIARVGFHDTHTHSIDCVTGDEKQAKHIIFLYPHVQLISNVTRVFSLPLALIPQF